MHLVIIWPRWGHTGLKLLYWPYSWCYIPLSRRLLALSHWTVKFVGLRCWPSKLGEHFFLCTSEISFFIILWISESVQFSIHCKATIFISRPYPPPGDKELSKIFIRESLYSAEIRLCSDIKISKLLSGKRAPKRTFGQAFEFGFHSSPVWLSHVEQILNGA